MFLVHVFIDIAGGPVLTTCSAHMTKMGATDASYVIASVNLKVSMDYHKNAEGADLFNICLTFWALGNPYLLL